MRRLTGAWVLGVVIALLPSPTVALDFDVVGDFSTTTNTDTSRWSYRFSSDRVRDGSYSLLPTFSSQTLPTGGTLWVPTTSYWNNGPPVTSLPGAPPLGVKVTGSPIRPNPAFTLFLWPAATVWMHPASAGLVVVSWLSPADLTVDIQFVFTDIDPNGGDGVSWFVDRNAEGLASGTLPSGGTSGPQVLRAVTVRAGDRIHFVVDPRSTASFDSTTLLASISPVTAPPSTLQIVRTVSQGLGGVPADGASRNPSVSASGRFVAFESAATNLVPSGCTAGTRQVFLRDRLTQTTTCLSVASNGAPGNAPSARPAISADGRFVDFESAATNLVPSGCRVTGRSAVFARDRTAGTTTCASVGPGGVAADAPATAPAISGDGNLVVFVSSATTLGGGCAGGAPQVFVRDRAAATTACLSVGPTGAQGNGPSGEPAISGDGRFVAFESAARNLVAAGCITGVGQVFLRDRMAGTTTCASASGSGAPGDAASTAPALNDDGNVIAFASAATNLASPCAGLQVYVRDRTLGRLQCLSIAPDGTPGDGPSFAPAVSGDGRVVVFSSQATNLTGSALALRGVVTEAPPTGTFSVTDSPAVIDAVNRLFAGTTGDGTNSVNRDGSVVAAETTSPTAGSDIAAVETVPAPPAGQPLIVQPAPGTVLTVVGGIQLTVQWTAVAGATSYRLQFTGPLPAPVTLETPNTTTFTAALTPDIPPGTYQAVVVPLSAGGAGTPSSPVPFVLVPGVAAVAADRPFVSTPEDGLTVRYSQSVTVAWTAVAGATQYGFEFTGVNRQFTNPNGTAPDSANGFGGLGGGFPVSGTSVTGPIPPGIAVGSYQVRIIGIGAAGAVGSFSDAVTLNVMP